MGMGQSQLEVAGLRDQLSKTHGEQHADALLSVYAETLQARGAESSPFEINVAIGTDQIFRVPAIRLAEAQKIEEQRQTCYEFGFGGAAAAAPLYGGRRSRRGECDSICLHAAAPQHPTCPGLRGARG